MAEGTIVWRRGDAAGVAFTVVPPASAPAVAEYIVTHTDEEETPR